LGIGSGYGDAKSEQGQLMCCSHGDSGWSHGCMNNGKKYGTR
jgi:hypothetical protein